MSIQKYAVSHHSIQTLINRINSQEIVIPENQRPFVWDRTKVRNLLDSLYKGYPIGYLISWHTPSVKLKDGSSASGKNILIDGQQRLTALMALLHGREILTKEYETARIRIAFQPQEERFEVATASIAKDPAWIADVATVFAPEFKVLDLIDKYCAANPQANRNAILERLERLRSIGDHSVGLIELKSELSIEEVANIFVRVNTAGTELSQADFALSKIATNETYGGNTLRKTIDYFCHMAAEPKFYTKIQKYDPEFASTEFYSKMAWLKTENDDIYDPSQTDMLRVAFTAAFLRGKLQDLIGLLSGRNDQTGEHEEPIAEAAFGQLKEGIVQFMNEAYFKRFVTIIRSAGFIEPSLIGDQEALNFAYIIYLTLRAQSVPPLDIDRAVRRWFVMSVLRGRYSTSPETTFDYDIRYLHEQGYQKYFNAVIDQELSPTYWHVHLPEEMETASVASPAFKVYRAAQVKSRDKGFLSREISIEDLILNRAHVHRIFPKGFLKRIGLTRWQYDQIANFALAQSEINIAIGVRPPAEYLKTVVQQCNGGRKIIGTISDQKELEKNLAMHSIPKRISSDSIDGYTTFLKERRRLMALKIKEYFDRL